MDEKFDLMEKIQKKIFFPWKESVFDEKWREESIKMVSTFYNDDFGSKIAFFDVLARYCD